MKGETCFSSTQSSTRTPAPSRSALFLLLIFSASAHLQAASHLITWGASTYGLAVYPTNLVGIKQIAGGGEHGLALTTNGTVVGWGGNMDGQADVPPDLPEVVAIAAGGNHSVALLADGTVRAWGANNDGQCSIPGDYRAKVIAAGASRTATIGVDGEVRTWGVTTGPAPPDFTNVVSLAVNGPGLMALRADGTIAVAGYPFAPVPPEATNAIAIAMGLVHFLALRGDGTVVAWGIDSKGQLQVPPNLTNVTAISANGEHNVALRSDGTVERWGDMSWYDRPPPAGLTNVSMISAGAIHALVVGALAPTIAIQPLSNSVFSGNMATFQTIASGSPPLRYQWLHAGAPLPGATESTLNIPEATTAQAGSYTVVLSNDLGAAPSGEAWLAVSDATPAISLTSRSVVSFVGGTAVMKATISGSRPLAVQWLKDQAPIIGATDTTLELTPVAPGATGLYSLVASNPFGHVESPPVAIHLTPVAFWGTADRILTNVPALLTNAVRVAVRDRGYKTGVALLADGRVTSWGSVAPLRTPPNLTDAVAIAAGDGFGMALRAEGEVAVWGVNTYKQTSIPLGLFDVVAIAAGQGHCLALKQNGTVVGWGNNSLKQATPPADLRDVVAISAGFAHSVALRRDGSAVAWGINVVGQTNVPASATRLVAIAAGGDHSLGLKQDGSVVAWGDNRLGQTNVPAGLSNVMALTAADNYSMALRADGSLVI